ncbi:MAG TPA: class I SAM-dependent methyltransferase [Frankiaceae bacterium]|nr:class I SAM-dependent methyltransferase [Frankiaceae bacterium]
MDPVETVRRAYDAIGEDYHRWSHADPTRIAYVTRLAARLPEGSLVLELGCGPGDPATRLLSESHRVVGVELSWGQLEIARVKAPRAALVQADMTRLAVRPGSVDAIASFFALGHLPSAAHAPLLTSFGTWLKPGGVLVTTAPLHAGEGYEDEWLGEPTFFGGIGHDATIAALEAGGLTIESVERLGDEENGVFDWITATKDRG